MPVLVTPNPDRSSLDAVSYTNGADFVLVGDTLMVVDAADAKIAVWADGTWIKAEISAVALASSDRNARTA